MHPFNQPPLHLIEEGTLTVYPPIDPPRGPPIYVDEGPLKVVPNEPASSTYRSDEHQPLRADPPWIDYRPPSFQSRTRKFFTPEHSQLPNRRQTNQPNMASPLIREMLLTSQARLQKKVPDQQLQPTEQGRREIWAARKFQSQQTADWFSQQHMAPQANDQVSSRSGISTTLLQHTESSAEHSSYRAQQLREPLHRRQLELGQPMQPQRYLLYEQPNHPQQQQHGQGAKGGLYPVMRNAVEK
ncbi:hypothetical protein CDEST_12316 [Colletotrichum destructivum]|uniref:Uncharacterized protein n=1 Tax=Colletotrichum destructivum TaxID=34406 RepID=A0AAX4IW45_9PEZI|nr:hypothetical protein CDEST_12316 [Colletotrichum destructivum]